MFHQPSPSRPPLMELAEWRGTGWCPAPALSSGQCAGSTGREVPADRGLSASNGNYKLHLVNKSRSTGRSHTPHAQGLVGQTWEWTLVGGGLLPML